MSSTHTPAHNQFNRFKRNYQPFSYDELKRAIIAAGGIPHFSAEITLSDKLRHEEIAGTLHHDLKTHLYYFCSPFPCRSA
ncbi:MAG: hypothetical protein HGA67_02110 [Candidatus Yonathbacteria bacterium]|nr:hypothetical protein [Candidatus Yonathbacteria bacterium]